MQQITEFEKKIESLINEITEFKDQIYYLQSCKENQSNWKRIDIEKRIPTTQNEILEDKILKKESECDKYLEYYLRCNQLIESEMKIKDLIVTFQMQFMEIIKDAEILKEEYGIYFLPDKYKPVKLFSSFITSSGVPSETIFPP